MFNPLAFKFVFTKRAHTASNTLIILLTYLKLMRLKRLLRLCLAAATLTGVAFSAASCQDDDTAEGGPVTYGEVSGIVYDEAGDPLADVAVTAAGVKGTLPTEAVATATTAADGSYRLAEVPVGELIVTFTKKDYQTIGATLTAASFVDGKAVVNVEKMCYAAAKIMGRVLDSRNENAPFEGAIVRLNDGMAQTTTDAEGKFLFENLMLDNYALSVSTTKDGYVPVTMNVKVDDFVDETADLGDIVIGAKEILPGMTIDDLRKLDKWYANEYRGGKGNGGGELDWSTVFLSTLDFRGNWENQNEGVTLRIRNDGAEQSNPADFDHFDSYVLGNKLITADNKILSVMVRTHNASAEAPAHWGVRVIDLTAEDPTPVQIGDKRTHGSDSYNDHYFDLSAYVGKEVTVMIGIYRAETGDYWKQLPIRHISFAAEENKGDAFLPGEEVPGLEGWHMTMEMLRSTMPQTLRKVNGVFEGSVDGKDGRGYNPFRNFDHIAAKWAFMYVQKDVEPTPSEGFVIKTHNGNADLQKPMSYFYAKHSIAAGADQLVLRARNFDGGKFTYFKLTAITEDGTFKHLQPAEVVAERHEAGPDGTYKFINNKGGKGTPDDYASFTYDLSEYDGQDVMLCWGVFKGETTDGEQKLCIYSAELK